MSDGNDLVDDFIRKRNERVAAEANPFQHEAQQNAPGYGEFENPFKPKPTKQEEAK